MIDINLKSGLAISGVLIGLSSVIAPTVYAQTDNTSAGNYGFGAGLVMPQMDAAAGRKLYSSKGCVVCHSVNGVGGEDAPPLDAETMNAPMNPFDFAAKMWSGAEAMVAMQRDELGDPIELTGQDLANIIAFVHDSDQQATYSMEEIPENIAELIEHHD